VGQAFHAEDFLTDGDITLGITFANLAADHHPDHIVHGDILNVLGIDVLAVTQDGDAVAQTEDFFHSVGDIHDGDALLAQGLDDREQTFGLGFGQSGGRLVHDDDLGIHHQSLADFHHLLLTNGQIGHDSIDGDVDAHTIHDFLRLGAHGFLVADAELLGDLLTHEQVFLHRQVKENVQFLIDEHNTGLFCFLGALVADFLAIHKNRACIFGVNAREDLHQGGLAGAVFAHQSMDLAVLQVKTCVLQYLIRSKGLTDALHLDVHSILLPPIRQRCSPPAE